MTPAAVKTLVAPSREASSSPAVLKKRLAAAEAKQQRRELPQAVRGVDFCSNDYLGLARNTGVRHRLAAEFGSLTGHGSTGSRLLSGNTAAAEDLEAEVARWHGAETALLFNSGYNANVGLLSSLPRDDCHIFYDERVHASVKDGIALSRAWAQPFRHNQLEHLEQRLKRAVKTQFVVIESLYSMDGDLAPLVETVDLCARYGAHLIVDEAHAAGIYGERGAGLVCAQGLGERVFARVVTYGKAYGCHGAAVLGPRLLRDYLVNFAHAFIYTTALPAVSMAAIRAAYCYTATGTEQTRLQGVIQTFRRSLAQRGLLSAFLPSTTQIQGLRLPLTALLAGASVLTQAGYDVKPIRSPTVQRGSERLRICLHSFNTASDIAGLVDLTGGLL